eukprot:TRINITY_DN3831_c0_g1_i3.p1 TRINITY_DN3831_c0_g1~~TRINITY_DN3831_c0_g1_i3.p1  ORF type:complete len:337 (-),score=51.33 TRINITY_DN3831_c0_g1_i3:242-1252(-)
MISTQAALLFVLGSLSPALAQPGYGTGYGQNPNTGSIHGAFAVDPPWCATRTTGFINDACSIAQQAVAITGDCVGDALSDTSCAGDIFSLLVSISDAAEMLSQLAQACTGEKSTCVSSNLDTAEYVFTLGANLIGASVNCDSDVFLCLINCIDSADNIVDMAQDIRSSVQNCPVQSGAAASVNAGLPRLLRAKWGDTMFESATSDSSDSTTDKGRVSPFFKAIVGTLTSAKTDTQTGVWKLTSNPDGDHTTVVDDGGLFRFGNRYVTVNSDSYLSSAGHGALHDATRRLQEFQVSEVDMIESQEVEVYFLDSNDDLKLLDEDHDGNDVLGFHQAYE